MFDQCGTDAQTGKPLNCQYDKPAPAITDDKGKRLLAELCPQFVNQTSGILFTRLHVQKAYTSLGTSCHNVYTKFFCSQLWRPYMSSAFGVRIRSI